VRATRDKHLARQRLKGSGIKVPEFWRFSTSEDPAAASQRVTYPCVLKPTFLSASRGVIRSDDEKEFVVAFERLQHLLDEPAVREKGGDAAGWILVESFIVGTEVALEGLLTQGELKTLALFDKPDPLEGPFFEETLYVTPSRLPAEVQSQIQHSAASTAARLGLREGPVHAELRVNDEGVWPLEMAARSIGGLCSRALRFGAGISLEELILRHALRMDLDAMERERKAAGVMMIPIPRAGILRSFTAESARKVPGVEELVQSIPLGQALLPLPEGSRYLGFIFARAATPAEVEAALREAHGRLEIVIE
jgi:biotin carboxylase